MKKVLFLFLLGLFFIENTYGGEHCSICVIDTCKTFYWTSGDGDGDGMSDDLERQLAQLFKPTLYLDNSGSEKPFFMPDTYSIPPYSHEVGDNHGLPPDIVSDGTIYYRVHPCGVVEPGRCYYIEVVYWFYFTYNQAECQNGYWAEHGHDWEHMALALTGPLGHYRVQRVWYAQHEGGEYVEPSDAPWVGVPQLSGVKVYLVDGSHASYPSPGERCAFYDPETGFICMCHENANGQFELQVDTAKLVPLYELGEARAPLWLNYSDRWPGYSSEYGKPPYGPAFGNHAYAWNTGHFGGVIPFCLRTNLEIVPEPSNFVVSRYKNGQPLENALYLTWNDPPSGPEDGFVIMKKRDNGLGCYNDSGYACLVELPPYVHQYTDSCLDGGFTYCYKLETYHYHPDASYRGCSLPVWGWGDVSGGECPHPPTAPRLVDCNDCILKWQDNSDNEDGFRILFQGNIVGTKGPNSTSFSVSNCNTGKYGYRVEAYNAYGARGACCMPCNGGSGGCPFVYTWDGKDFILDNNILSLSEDTLKEQTKVTDYYLLSEPLVPKDNEYHLKISEFEQEHSYLDYFGLITVDHPRDKKISVTTDGKIFAYYNPISPVSCVDNKGTDCLSEVLKEDGAYYKNDNKGYLILSFGILKSSNNGLAKILLESPGGVPTDPGEKEDNCDKIAPYLVKPQGNIVCVEVLLESGEWTTVSKIPPRLRSTPTLVELSPYLSSDKEFKVRISWEQSYTLDHIAYYTFDSSSLIINEYGLSSAIHSAYGSTIENLTRKDDSFTELTPSQTLDLVFPCMKPDSTHQRNFILVSRGYYKSFTAEDTLFSGGTKQNDSIYLEQNAPNPFNPETKISFVISKSMKVKIEIFNLLGQKVVTLIDQQMEAGKHTVIWNGKNQAGESVSNGVYFYKLEAGDKRQVMKMCLIK